MKINNLKFVILFIFVVLLGIGKGISQTNQFLDFDGTNDWVRTPNASQLIANSTQMTIAGWFFNSQLGGTQGMIGFRTSSQTFNLSELASGVIQCRLVNSAGTTYQIVTPQNTIIPNIWQHWAWVYTGSRLKLYLNGNLIGDTAASGTITNATISFGIGKADLASYNFYYKGRIDEVSLWNKALSQSEIQSMKQNGLLGNESGLKLYYKFNQGVPGGNNQSITKLISEINSPLYDGDLIGFALTGAASNFNGTLDTSFQAISFPPIPTQLISSPPVKLIATSTSGLPVGFTVVSGPATISNDTCYLTGPGTVKIMAYQNGNTQYDTAVPVTNTFDVVDPAQNLPIIDVRNPLPGNVQMPSLANIQLVANASINYTSLFSVQELHFKINGTNIPSNDFGNGHYTAWWQPSAYGTVSIQVIATSNMGAVATTTYNINVVQTANDTTFQAFGGVLINDQSSSQTISGNLPSYAGAYDTIFATLVVSCPTGGCGEWDRIASVEALSPEGNWFEIIRYITPYGVACSHKTNLTDYMSLLQGKVTFRVNCGTTDNGYLYALNFDFRNGTPAHYYSQVSKIWKNKYPFGDYANLQPVGTKNYTFPSGTVASTLKLVSTGHGWGSLNTGNAAEFYDATHNIWVNGVNTFTQHNWTTCNPNPDGCMPQNGTWQYNRAGWCPGSIAKPFDYNLTPYISGSNIALKYVFYQQYLDECHPNNPNCVTGVTCDDCTDGFNPFFEVNCNLINFFDNPPPKPEIDTTGISLAENQYSIAVFPNPSNGIFYLSTNDEIKVDYNVEIYSCIGMIIRRFKWDGETRLFDFSNLSSGVYIIKVSNSKGEFSKKLIIN